MFKISVFVSFLKSANKSKVLIKYPVKFLTRNNIKINYSAQTFFEIDQIIINSST